MNIFHTAAYAIAVGLSTPALAQDSEHRLGDHPAIVVQRLHAQAGYDYASKFYPHPAWLYLLPEEPHRMNQHPAVLAFKREQERQQALGGATVPPKLALVGEQQ